MSSENEQHNFKVRQICTQTLCLNLCGNPQNILKTDSSLDEFLPQGSCSARTIMQVRYLATFCTFGASIGRLAPDTAMTQNLNCLEKGAQLVSDFGQGHIELQELFVKTILPATRVAFIVGHTPDAPGLANRLRGGCKTQLVVFGILNFSFVRKSHIDWLMHPSSFGPACHVGATKFVLNLQSPGFYGVAH